MQRGSGIHEGNVLHTIFAVHYNCFPITQFKQGGRRLNHFPIAMQFYADMRKSLNHKSLWNEVKFLYYTSNTFVKVFRYFSPFHWSYAVWNPIPCTRQCFLLLFLGGASGIRGPRGVKALSLFVSGTHLDKINIFVSVFNEI